MSELLGYYSDKNLLALELFCDHSVEEWLSVGVIADKFQYCLYTACVIIVLEKQYSPEFVPYHEYSTAEGFVRHSASPYT